MSVYGNETRINLLYYEHVHFYIIHVLMFKIILMYVEFQHVV